MRHFFILTLLVAVISVTYQSRQSHVISYIIRKMFVDRNLALREPNKRVLADMFHIVDDLHVLLFSDDRVNIESFQLRIEELFRGLELSTLINLNQSFMAGDEVISIAEREIEILLASKPDRLLAVSRTLRIMRKNLWKGQEVIRAAVNRHIQNLLQLQNELISDVLPAWQAADADELEFVFVQTRAKILTLTQKTGHGSKSILTDLDVLMYENANLAVRQSKGLE